MVFVNISFYLISASNFSSKLKLVLALMVEPDMYGVDLWDVFDGMCLVGFGVCGSWFQANMKLPLIPNMMYLWGRITITQN